jgi:tetratricopeptide (TPR) repeat protein
MSSDTILDQAIQALEAGQHDRARDLLTRLLKENPQKPEAWLWMSAAVKSKKEQIYCLQQVLRFDPENADARQGLIMLGELAAPDSLMPAPLIRRKWDVSLTANDFLPADSNKHHLSRRQMVALGGVGTLVLVLMTWGAFGAVSRGWSPFRPRLTVTPLAWTHTPTLYVTVTPSPIPSATLTPAGPTPLSNLLQATYTPTALYVSTPHTISEAYRAAMRAFENQEYEQMLSLLTQAADVEPDAPDILYHMGQARYFLGEYTEALAHYEQALTLDDTFAPAYLGRARVRSILDPDEDILADLDQAILLDSQYGEAYLARAAYVLQQDELEAALDDLEAAKSIIPDSPEVYLLLAQVLLAMDDPAAALAAAQSAYEKDITLIDTYATLGKIYLINGFPGDAVPYLEIYSDFRPDDPDGWLNLAKAIIQTGLSSARALYALDQASDLQDNLPEIYALRGLVYLEQGEGQEAVNDLIRARNLGDRSFENGLNLGRALTAAGRDEDAAAQFLSIQTLADTDEQKAALYYWRAQIQEKLGNRQQAVRDWEALEALPEGSAPDEWIEFAAERLLALTQPTSTPTPTRTSAPSASQTPITTPTRTITP